MKSAGKSLEQLSKDRLFYSFLAGLITILLGMVILLIMVFV